MSTNSCLICLEDIEANAEDFVHPVCGSYGHLMHRTCLAAFRNNARRRGCVVRCPLCRREETREAAPAVVRDRQARTVEDGGGEGEGRQTRDVSPASPTNDVEAAELRRILRTYRNSKHFHVGERTQTFNFLRRKMDGDAANDVTTVAEKRNLRRIMPMYTGSKYFHVDNRMLVLDAAERYLSS